jgi:hypothetical protein
MLEGIGFRFVARFAILPDFFERCEVVLQAQGNC